MIVTGINNEKYEVGNEIGRGGEGIVFDVINKNDIVFKKYIESLSTSKIDKLCYMVSIKSAVLEAYSAWPLDVVRDETGIPCGFIMKKLKAFVPLHVIFSPMDRKKYFPDKGYNFLVHVARNLSTAFYQLHEAGVIAGDVNEGNILINANGLVSFIDCDSFQIKDTKNNYYLCEVGVPRYTPPELLEQESFAQIIRTVNTDSFSLSVLIFQLLFLGRHPFAGKNNTQHDIDEETAIRQHEFAYSLEKKNKKLLPPNNSIPITSLPATVVSLFHKAFEQETRPNAAEWVKALDSLLAEMTTCTISKIHSYPAQLDSCPWCDFKNRHGILFFIDNSYLHTQNTLHDIESFVQGFVVEKMLLKKWNETLIYPDIKANVIHKKLQQSALLKKWMEPISLVVVEMVLFFSFQTNYFFLFSIFFGAIVFFARKYFPWRQLLLIEQERRKQELKQYKEKLYQSINLYNQSQDIINYEKQLSRFQEYIIAFKNLPDTYNKLKNAMEEGNYNEQLTAYLKLFAINDYTIPTIGTVKKTTLYNFGIQNAADIYKLSTSKIPTIGPKNIQTLLSWQRQMVSGFVYIPDTYRIAIGMQDVDKEIKRIKADLEMNIRNEYKSLSYFKATISNRSAILEIQIRDLGRRAYQAEIDCIAFEKIAA